MEEVHDYNIVDAELADRLEDKMKLIGFYTTAYDAKVNYVDVFYQVRMGYDHSNYLKKRNIVIHRKRICKDAKYRRCQRTDSGKYDWVVA